LRGLFAVFFMRAPRYTHKTVFFLLRTAFYKREDFAFIANEFP